MTSVIQRYSRNTLGRDFAVGDIHGQFSRLQRALDVTGFDASRDRLFSVGDLVDRGPECEAVLGWLDLPWFHPVRGNHEDIAIRYARGNPVDAEVYSRNGGDWFMALPVDRQVVFATAFETLPFAIEVETEAGVVGLVHADCPRWHWGRFTAVLAHDKSVRTQTMWLRRRIESGDTSGVGGIRAVIAGHTPIDQVRVLGNVWHIDTGGWLADDSGFFTLLDLATV